VPCKESVPTCVAGVHGDEDADARVERDLRVLKVEDSGVHRQRVLDGRQLRRDDRQDRDVDAVELIKAAPRAALAQSGEDLAHHLVVHALAAVGDDAEQAECLGEVLGRLRLAGARWSSRRSAELHRQRLGQCEVDAVSERRDDQSSIESHVLVAVAELARTLTNDQLVRDTLPVEPAPSPLHRHFTESCLFTLLSHSIMIMI